MDIKRKYFDLIIDRVDLVYKTQEDKMKQVAALFGQCMENLGVVQLFGFNHCEEFVNELNYRAGGIAPFHAYKIKDLVLKGLVNQSEVDSGAVYNDVSLLDKFASIYQLDDRDMVCIVSFTGAEPILVEFAKRAKEKGQKVVAVVNKATYDKTGSKLLDYADVHLDMCAQDPDVAMDLDGLPLGQLSSTSTNVMAQMLTAEVYNWFTSNGKVAPVLLSANVKGADVHNNALTDPYERRVR